MWIFWPSKALQGNWGTQVPNNLMNIVFAPHHKYPWLSDIVASKDFKTPSYAYIIRIMVLNRFMFKQVYTGADVDIMIKSVWILETSIKTKAKLHSSVVGFAIVTFKYHCWRGAMRVKFRIAIIGRKEAPLRTLRT